MRIFRGFLKLVGIITAFTGILIGMCDCNTIELQLRTMAISIITFLVGCLVTFVASQLPESVKR